MIAVGSEGCEKALPPRVFLWVHFRTPAGGNTMSALPRIVLKKSFWDDDQNFSGPLMPFARGDMRDHIVSHKNDHGRSHGRYAVLQW